MKKKLFVGFFSLILFILAGCSATSLNGTWNFEGNQEGNSITLAINNEVATVSIDSSSDEGFNGTEMSMYGKILVGKLDTENEVITVTQESDVTIESLGQSYSGETLGFDLSVGDTVSYILSDDKKSIVLDVNINNFGSMNFIKE